MNESNQLGKWCSELCNFVYNKAKAKNDLFYLTYMKDMDTYIINDNIPKIFQKDLTISQIEEEVKAYNHYEFHFKPRKLYIEVTLTYFAGPSGILGLIKMSSNGQGQISKWMKELSDCVYKRSKLKDLNVSLTNDSETLQDQTKKILTMKKWNSMQK